MIGVEGVLLEDPTGLAAEYAKQALEEEPEKKDNHSLLNEARGEDYHVPVYEGWIAHAAGDYAQADRIWDEMVERYPQVWFAWSVRADAYVKQARYDEAIACYRRAIACQTPPRFTDNEDSIAQICMIRGDTDGAIEAYECASWRRIGESPRAKRWKATARTSRSSGRSASHKVQKTSPGRLLPGLAACCSVPARPCRAGPFWR